MFRLVKSDLMSAGRPPTGRATNAAFLATMLLSAEIMTGWKLMVALRMELASAVEMGSGVMLYGKNKLILRSGNGTGIYVCVCRPSIDIGDDALRSRVDGLLSTRKVRVRGVRGSLTKAAARLPPVFGNDTICLLRLVTSVLILAMSLSTLGTVDA